MNISFAKQTLMALAKQGVKEYCLCAGARNSPFVFLLEQARGAKVYHFFEERSASFFAIGRIQATQCPVAVITTSGTAVAELLPACIEAFYQGLPLILVTADRPKSYRKTGAPQSIEQRGIFTSYVADHGLDIEASNAQLEPFHLQDCFQKWTGKIPLHLNICFDEPLIDEDLHPWDYIPTTAVNSQGQSEHGKRLQLDQALVIVNSLGSMSKEQLVKELLRLNSPVFAEALSGIRSEDRLGSLLIRGGEKTVEQAFKQGLCKSVLRIGGVPTLRFWRDLEERYKHIPVYSFSDAEFSGLARPSEVLPIAALSGCETKQVSELTELDQLTQLKLTSLLDSYPLSEPALIRTLSSRLEGQSVYLGNSLPIREWDLVSQASPLRSMANRGANGIDGQLSTFFGWANPTAENWALLGDLTTLYDLSAPWVCRQLQAQKMRIVVINNLGGQIFHTVFRKDIFLNRHELSFEHWARMWQWEYNLWRDIPDDFSDLSDKLIIELRPDENQSRKFWDLYREL